MRRQPTSGFFALLLSSMLACVSLAIAQESTSEQGFFDVRSASTSLVNGVQELDARLQLVLSADALGALNSGVPLTIELNLEVIRVKRFMLDATDAELNLQYELEYRPLSQRYIVRNLNSGDQDSFATLYSALNNLGRVQELPIIDNSLLDPNAEYRIRLQALLSTRSYPAALRLLFFWRGDWQIKSDWYEWRLER
jgi:hypothetical protein